MNPFTDTRNIRLVVARYVTSNTVFASLFNSPSSGWDEDLGVVSLNVRLTCGESSSSTSRASRADDARW